MLMAPALPESGQFANFRRMIASRAMLDACLTKIERDGFAVLPGVFDEPAVEAIAAQLSPALSATRDEAESIRSRAGTVYAARNVVTLWPEVRDVWRRPAIVELLSAALGREFGLVRVLYFDKPPERSWSLPWHKDLTIAVRDNSLPSERLRRPTTKAGVPHVEASLDVLSTMLTVRVHLDQVTEENGPLKVIPGSHHQGKQSAATAAAFQSILVAPGDVLAIRPLVAHSSDLSHPGTTRRRRILHFEFSGLPRLPDGFEWHDFYPGMPNGIHSAG